MLIRLFRTSQPILAILLLLPIGLTSYASYTYHFTTLEANGMPFYDGILFLVGGMPTWVRVTISMSLIYLQAIHLQFILKRHEVLYKESWLPALMYILLATMLPEFQWFQPMLFINSLLLFALDRIFFLYKNDKPLALDFDVGFIIGLASLFYLPLLVFIIFFGAALILLRPFSWRDWATGIIGVALPLFFAFCYYFLTDHLILLYEKMVLSGIGKPKGIGELLKREYLLSLSAPALVIIIGLMKQLSNFYKNVTRTRLNQLVIILFAITGIIAVVFNDTPQVSHFLILAIPASVWAGYYFLSIKRILIAEVSLILVIAGWTFNNFF